MKCAYCNNDIAEGTGVRQGEYYFCNSVHRYSWKIKNIPKAASDKTARVILPKISPQNYLMEFTIGVVGLVLLAAGVYFFVSAAENRNGEKNSGAETAEMQWEAFVKRMNDECPVKFDQEIQLQNVSLLPDKVLLYNYKLTNFTANKIDEPQLRNYFRPKFIELIKTREDLRTFRENNFTFVNKFRNKKGAVISEITINKEDYL